MGRSTTLASWQFFAFATLAVSGCSANRQAYLSAQRSKSPTQVASRWVQNDSRSALGHALDPNAINSNTVQVRSASYALGIADDETNDAIDNELLKVGKISEQSVPMSVNECVQIALTYHPKILAARARVDAARSRIPQVKALPDPMLDNMFWPIHGNSLETVGGRMQNQMALAQQVPWPEKLSAKAAIACRELQMAQTEVESIEREVAETVKLAYYEIWITERSAQLLRESEKSVVEILRAAEARYRSGGSQQDVINAELEREKLRQQLLEAASQQAAAQSELASYLQQTRTLQITPDERLPIDDLPTQLDVLIETAERCNPQLKGLAYQIQRDLQKQRLADLQRYPDFQFGSQYGFMTRSGALSPVADGKDMISFSVGVTLPIWRDKIQGGINEAASNRIDSSQLRASEQLTIEGRLRRLLAEIDSLDRQHSLYIDRIIPRAEQSLKIGVSEYTVGKTSFVQLENNYRELLMFQLQAARIEATLASRMAQLRRTVGCNELDASAIQVR